ncbi:hypothetical protein EVAR_103509_1 [Eumeta japonica]|uniref:Peptidase A2 domain-containing protein n=1 Tax=Eumeta variegata TaxID=151549 RepID=A0A4C1YW95_EUMVA|nr:hypothetical protein EVAR_103509_1 [Eumeta japonica]
MPRTQNNEDAGSDSITTPDTSNEVCRFTTKMPPFWPEKLRIFFTQVESPCFYTRDLTSEIAELRRQMRQLTTHSYRQLHAKSRGHPQGRSRSKSHTRSVSRYRKYPTCWYHSRFANKANKCVKPNDFKAHRAVANGDRRLPYAPGRLFVTDRCIKMQFLVDTGSEICVFPRSAVHHRRTRTTYQLSAANVTIIYLRLHQPEVRHYVETIRGDFSWPMSPNLQSEQTFFNFTTSWWISETAA